MRWRNILVSSSVDTYLLLVLLPALLPCIMGTLERRRQCKHPLCEFSACCVLAYLANVFPFSNLRICQPRESLKKTSAYFFYMAFPSPVSWCDTFIRVFRLAIIVVAGWLSAFLSPFQEVRMFFTINVVYGCNTLKLSSLSQRHVFNNKLTVEESP